MLSVYSRIDQAADAPGALTNSVDEPRQVLGRTCQLDVGHLDDALGRGQWRCDGLFAGGGTVNGDTAMTLAPTSRYTGGY